jgi:magnesium-transporting ATPase (P-type)
MAIVLIIAILVICSGAVLGSFVFHSSHTYERYLKIAELHELDYFLLFFRWIFTANMFIPLALYSSLDLVRFFLSRMLNNDSVLRNINQNTICRNSDLVSTLGRCTHVFADKTGTITKNLMFVQTFDLTSKSLAHISNYQRVFSEKLVAINPLCIQWVKSNQDSIDVHDFLLTICCNNDAKTILNPTYYPEIDIKNVFPSFSFSNEFFLFELNANREFTRYGD